MAKPATKSWISRLLVPVRLRDSTIAGRNVAQEALSDKGRIITSASFRRLQVKAQVFSLEENAAVRSRLTHSLEVAAMGEIIARLVADALLKDNDIDGLQASALITTAENACLLHDVGNPPFGHLGEYAIANWFQQHHDIVARRWSNHGLGSKDIELYLSGLSNFDGNPQGFRTVTRLSWLNDPFGLNLTCGLLASLIKYLGCQPGSAKFNKKVGYFATETDRIRDIWKLLRLPSHDDGSPRVRHPLCYIMEAADDISYCLSDIADAIEKGIVRESDFFKYLALKGNRTPLLAEIEARVKRDAKTWGRNAGPDAKFSAFKIAATRRLGEVASKSFLSQLSHMEFGTITDAIMACDQNANASMTILKNFTRQYVFRSREAVTVEVSGFHILQKLLDKMSLLTLAGSREFDRILLDAKGAIAKLNRGLLERVEKAAPGELPLHVRLATLLPRRHLLNYFSQRRKSPAFEPVFRAHLIVDYIAGMTDNHAVKTFSVLEGLDPGEVSL